MAKKKVVTNTREETEVEVPAAVEVDEAPDDLFSFEGFDGDGGKFRVHRMPTKPGEGSAYCQDYTRDELSLDSIRASWGGGKFRITAFDAQNRIAGSKQIQIAELPKSPSSQIVAVPAAAANADATQLMLMKFIEGQSQMVAALLGREMQPAPAGPTAMELVTLIKALQPPESDRSDPVKMLLQGLELGKGLGGGDTGFMDIAKSGLEALGPLIAKQVSAPAAPSVPRTPRQLPQANGAAGAPHAAPAKPADAPAPAKPTTEELVKMDVLKKLKWLQATAAHLCQLAARNKSAGLYAEVFMDNLPPFITAQEVFERFSAQDAIAQLAQVDPNVQAYAPWFEEFRLEVLSLMDPDEEPPPGDEAPLNPLAEDGV